MCVFFFWFLHYFGHFIRTYLECIKHRSGIAISTSFWFVVSFYVCHLFDDSMLFLLFMLAFVENVQDNCLALYHCLVFFGFASTKRVSLLFYGKLWRIQHSVSSAFLISSQTFHSKPSTY